ncbi:MULTISPECIES: HAD hydrolase-like protein [Cryobacterium]|uniref:HAD family hydrolase n=1 Tax=Cryobacterium breve TaxID=1259258 RepID=A0ABY2IW06_9MICO|nr:MULTISPECIES: HAD hydrolase-like protein [Cryobacterium]TFC93118.1 HAD family hydrolase [Cryobacterium sp. TmT3-12]TFC96103.1 HAD family hydrolase [Cryobacterium breve]
MNSTLTRTWSAILFDLDGTITDSAPAITSSLARTFAVLGRPVPSVSELLAYVGPPLLAAFREYAGMTPDEAVEAVAVYRADYQNGHLLDTAIFPGVAGVLERIHAAKIPMAVATSKTQHNAIAVLEHFDLARYFAAIVGSTDTETRSSKADIVAEALERLGAAGADLTAPVMVGDRRYDAEGAAEHGVPTILVEWGYGSPAEATAAATTVYSSDRLAKLLLG